MEATIPVTDPPNHPTNVPLPLHHALSIQLTYLCNARCRFCALDCSPDSNETMDIRLAEKIIGEVAMARDKVWHVEVTGGEVFTVFPLLEELAHMFVKYEVPWIPITNTYWATADSRARELLSRLPGIQQIIFSADSHHAEFIPQENIVRAIRAAQSLNIHSFVTCGYFRGEEPGLNLFIPELREVLLEGDHVDYHFFPALDLGRAHWDCQEVVPKSWSEGPCYIMSRLEICPNGDYDACCVACAAVPDGLKPFRMRNAQHVTELETRQEFLRTPFYLALVTLGPAELYRRLIGPAESNSFLSICSPCIEICQVPDVKERVARLLEEENLWPKVTKLLYDLYGIKLDLQSIQTAS